MLDFDHLRRACVPGFSKILILVTVVACVTSVSYWAYKQHHEFSLELKLLSGRTQRWSSITFDGQGKHLLINDQQSVRYLENCFASSHEGALNQSVMWTIYDVRVKFADGDQCDFSISVGGVSQIVASTKELLAAGDPRYFNVDLPEPMPRIVKSALATLGDRGSHDTPVLER